MMSITAEKKTLVPAAATTITALGLLASPTPVHAGPMFPLTPAGDCHFVGVQVLDLDNGLEVILPSSGTTITGDASYSHPGQNDIEKGVANGTLTGTAVDIHVTWSGPFLFSHFTGQVNDDHSASGTVTNDLGNNDTTGWHTKFNDRIDCKKAPAPAEPPAPLPGPPAGSGPHPTPNSPPPATPTATTNADTDLYDKPSDQGGHVIGMLNKGQVVKVVNACSSSAWCILTDPAGAAWGRDLTNN